MTAADALNTDALNADAPNVDAPTTTVVTDGYPARVVIDLDAITANASRLRAAAGGAALMAVVKADAYGHGLVPVARAAIAGGATWLGVAQPVEAIALRAAGIGPDQARVLAWLYAPGAPLASLIGAEIDVAIAGPWAVAAVADAARSVGRAARVHVKVDTGLGRNGVTLDALDELLDLLAAPVAEKVIEVVGVWSHMAFADEPEHPTVQAQADVFVEAAARVRARGHQVLAHLANSAATLTNPAVHFDLVRPGLALYGLSPVPQLATAAELGLRPAMRVEAAVATVKSLPAGAGVSYAHQWHTTSETRVAVVPLGYADGIPRHASGQDDVLGAPVQLGGRRLAVSGRICMDQFVVDLGPNAAERAGDTVVLFGAGDDGEPTAEDWADAAGTISYEVVTRIGARVPRVYRTSGATEQG